MSYTTILHSARKNLKLSCNEYCVADSIHLLCSNPSAPVPGWCTMTRTRLGAELDLSRRTVIDIVNKLEKNNLVIRNEEDHLKTTKTWFDTVHGAKQEEENSRKRGVQNLHTPPQTDSADSAHPMQELHTPRAEVAHPRAESSQEGGADSAHNSNRNNNYSDNYNNKTSASAESASARVEVVDVEEEEKKEDPTPLPLAPFPKKKYGDGKLKEMVGDFYRSNPNLYKPEMYQRFLSRWTEKIINDTNSKNIGKEKWRTKSTFDVESRLESWYKQDIEDQKKNSNGSATQHNGQSTNGLRKQSASNGSADDTLKRTAFVPPGTLRRPS